VSQVRRAAGRWRGARSRPVEEGTVIVRFIRTCLARWAYAAAYRSSLQRAAVLPDWLRYYNRERPHTALGFKTPAQRLAECR